jgi:hypothetical protein
MQLRSFAQGPCSRKTGLGSVALAGMLVLLLGMGAATAQSERPNPLDPRFPDDYRAVSQLQRGKLRAIAETSYFNDRPLRCLMELNFSADYPNVDAQSKRIGNPVAALKRVELGFERRGDPFHSDDVHAFARLRVERVDNGAPLRVERIVLDYQRRFKAEHPSTAHWHNEALDAEGYGKISMPVAEMQREELVAFKGQTHVYSVLIALTLPELGQDRAYELPHAVTGATDPVFEACACAMQNARVSHRSVMRCDAPRYVPPGRR